MPCLECKWNEERKKKDLKKPLNPRVVYTSNKQKLWNAVLICFKEELKVCFIMLNIKNLDALGGKNFKEAKTPMGINGSSWHNLSISSFCSMTELKCIQHKALNCWYS